MKCMTRLGERGSGRKKDAECQRRLILESKDLAGNQQNNAASGEGKNMLERLSNETLRLKDEEKE